MKNVKMLAAALFAVVMVWASPGNARQQQMNGGSDARRDEAAVEETLKRLEKNLNEHGSLAVGGFIRRFDARAFRGCKISYELTPQVAPEHKGHVPFTERTTFDLSDVDPASVVVREGERGTASVSFATRGGRPVIEYRLGSEPHHFGDASRVTSSFLRLSNRKAAEEARASLARAAELCAR